MQRLIDGFRRFRETYFEENRALFSALAQGGQQPKVLMVGCCDSRVDPGLIFGAQPGEVFVLRNVANLVPPYLPDNGLHGCSAAVEFAIRNLKVEHVVVLGHAGCGGVQALLEASEEDSDFIGNWMSIASTARDRALLLAMAAGQSIEDAQTHCERETVAISLSNLMTFPWIRERVLQGTLIMHGWWFNLETGQLFRLDPVTNTFVLV